NPDYQIDFQAWKDSYLSKPKDKYLFADQLIAGIGAAWLKWSMLGIFLVAVSATALYYSGNMSNDIKTGDTSKVKIDQIAANDETNKDFQTEDYNPAFSLNENDLDISSKSENKTSTESEEVPNNVSTPEIVLDDKKEKLIDKKSKSVGQDVNKRGII